MKTIWEKRPGRWKVSGESKVFPTKEAALEWASSLFEVVEAEPEPIVEENIIEPVEVDFDPLEALKQARINNGNIEEGFNYDGDYSE